MKTWPRVTVNGPGTRPKTGPNKCFYCHKGAGEEHGRECVVVIKKIQLSVVFLVDGIKKLDAIFTLDCPYFWDTQAIEDFYCEEEPHLIEELENNPDGVSPRFPTNTEEFWKVYEDLPDDYTLDVKFLRVVDDTPMVDQD